MRCPRIQNSSGWIARRELAPLSAVLLLVAALWGFIEIADEVVEGETHAVDRRLILALRTSGDLADPAGPQWLEELARDATAMGGVGILGFITLSTAGFLLLQRKGRSALFLLLAVGGGLALSSALKAGFDRPRPDLVPYGSFIYTASFPSGHTTMSAVTYLTLGTLLARFYPQRRLKIYLVTLALVITATVGISRVYLGVHWPTDVLGGWALGIAWAMLCWLIARRLQNRHDIEPETRAAA